MKERKKILLLFDMPYVTPRGYDFQEEFKDLNQMMTEVNVYQALQEEGYRITLLGLHNDIRPLVEEIEEGRPDVVFNLMEVFNNQTHLDKNIAALLELLDVPYTGASPASLFICNDKALSKKILRFHRVRVPRFHGFSRGHRVWLPRSLKLPCIVKPLGE